MEKQSILNNFGKPFKGPLIIKPKVFEDERGFFLESWNQITFNKLIKLNVDFVQDNHSQSLKNVLRGMHYQIYPFPQSKLIRCTRGRILDVIVDLRTTSDTFGTWGSVELSEYNFLQLWIPKGFAHGFLALNNINNVIYKTDFFWNQKFERSLAWNDPLIGIKWGKDKKLNISVKDKESPFFKEIDERELIF